MGWLPGIAAALKAEPASNAASIKRMRVMIASACRSGERDDTARRDELVETLVGAGCGGPVRLRGRLCRLVATQHTGPESGQAKVIGEGAAGARTGHQHGEPIIPKGRCTHVTNPCREWCYSVFPKSCADYGERVRYSNRLFGWSRSAPL